MFLQNQGKSTSGKIETLLTSKSDLGEVFFRDSLPKKTLDKEGFTKFFRSSVRAHSPLQTEFLGTYVAVKTEKKIESVTIRNPRTRATKEGRTKFHISFVLMATRGEMFCLTFSEKRTLLFGFVIPGWKKKRKKYTSPKKKNSNLENKRTRKKNEVNKKKMLIWLIFFCPNDFGQR